MRTKLWQQLVLATFLATGFALVWGMLGAVGFNTFARRSSVRQGYEQLEVDASGKAWISLTDYSTGSEKHSRRTLEGEPLRDTMSHPEIASGFLVTPEDKSRRHHPRTWNFRVRELGDHHGEKWYLVQNGEEASGRAYLVSYDTRSKFLIGHLGRNGFRVETPDAEQSFALDGRTLAEGGWLVRGDSSYRITTQGKSGLPIESEGEPESSAIVYIVYLASGNGLMKVNLRARTVHTVDDSGAYLSVGHSSVVEEVFSAEMVPEGFDFDKIKTYGEDPLFDQYYKKRNLSAVVGRQQDQVVLFHPVKDLRHEFVIPEKLRSTNFSFYFVSPEMAVITTTDHTIAATEGGPITELFWINSQGQIQESKQVRLNRNHITVVGESVVEMWVAFPIPLLFVIGQISALYNDGFSIEMLTYVSSEALSHVLFVLLFALLAWFARRQHLKYSRPHTAAWCTMVFLLGVPGFVAYRLIFASPVMEKCCGCGEQAPRDREACAHCSEPFAEPVLVGTEVFA